MGLWGWEGKEVWITVVFLGGREESWVLGLSFGLRDILGSSILGFRFFIFIF